MGSGPASPMAHDVVDTAVARLFSWGFKIIGLILVFVAEIQK